MSFEKYIPIAEYKDDCILKVGQGQTIEFDGENLCGEKKNRLFFNGETGYFYYWKSEPKAFLLYHSIEDALDFEHAEKSRYCLNLSSEELCTYTKKAYKKILFPPVLGYLTLNDFAGTWKFGVFCKTKDLKVDKSGYMRVIVEFRTCSEGESRHSVADEPYFRKIFDIKDGTYDFTELSAEVYVPDNAGSLSFLIEGENYSGEVYFEQPFCVSPNGYNIIPDFAPAVTEESDFDWIGQNLSEKEQPAFEISLNGKTFFKGKMFERCHRYSECETDIPEKLLMPGKNVLTIRHISSYRDPAPYRLKRVGIITCSDRLIEIVAVPENITVGSEAGVLVKAKKNCEAIVEGNRDALVPLKEHVALKEGLNVIRFTAIKPANDVQFSVHTEGCVAESKIERICLKENDGILVGSGDLIYILQSKSDFEEYLEWYLSNDVGNLLTIRPTYRWSGSRIVNEEAFALLVKILTEYGVKYSHMVDGRELPGIDANPSLKMLEGKNFLGRQMHEMDGAFLYWGFNSRKRSFYREEICDLIHLACLRHPDTVNWFEDSGRKDLMTYCIFHRNPDVEPDMQIVAEDIVKRISDAKFTAIRHTGPSSAFRYFYMAGYEWLGAELMYGPSEIVISALRGAAKCYNKRSIGGHFAIQWSSSPHDSSDRFRRFYTALFVSYVQGLTEFNTEEGLWHLEEFYSYFNRFDYACKEHIKVQRDFYRYVSTHSRSGKFYTPFAILSGRYCGWRSFGWTEIFGRYDFDNSDAENSFDILDVFYPLEKANSVIYRHPCPADKPIGMFSGTPKGNIDIVPIEAAAGILSEYKALSFAGYNKATKEDMDKLQDYVEHGGILVLGWPHFSVTTNRSDVVNYKHKYIDHFLRNSICKEPSFVNDKAGGKPITVSSVLSHVNGVLKYTDSGLPLVVEYRIGKGRVFFVNAVQYPGNDGVKDVYRELISKVSEELNKNEEVFVECGDDVQFGIYLQSDGSKHVYVLAVDWYNDPGVLRTATLRIGGYCYPIKVKFGSLIKIVVSGDVAAWSEDVVGEVLSISERSVRIQGKGICRFVLAKDGKTTSKTADLSEMPVSVLSI